MATVSLISGALVDDASIEWREECAKRFRQVLDMRRLPLYQRRDYLANVQRREGDEAERRLREQFALDWERRKEDA